MTTKTQTEQPATKKEPLGTKAFDLIYTTVRAGLRFHSGTHNLRGMKNSVVRYLMPTEDEAGFIPCNADGFLIGESKPNMSVGRAWVLPKDAVMRASSMGLATNENGLIDLCAGLGAPWIDENFFKPWAARACAICGTDYGALFQESCRPQPKMFGSDLSNNI